MLVAVKSLVSGKKNTVGNHRREKGDNGVMNYIYHWTAICRVNDVDKLFTTDDGGWATRSTNRAINDYRRYFKDKGYTEIDKGTFKVKYGE
jgi:hypothetical protein